MSSAAATEHGIQLSMFDAGPGYYRVLATGPGWGCGHCRFYDSETLARESAARFARDRLHDSTTKLIVTLMEQDPVFASRLDWMWEAAARGERVEADERGRVRHYGHR